MAEDRKLQVAMPDGSLWEVPLAVIVGDHAKHWSDEPPLTDDGDIVDWAENNMNWTDVEQHATQVSPPSVDYEEGWVNGEKEIVQSTRELPGE